MNGCSFVGRWYGCCVDWWTAGVTAGSLVFVRMKQPYLLNLNPLPFHSVPVGGLSAEEGFVPLILSVCLPACLPACMPAFLPA